MLENRSFDHIFGYLKKLNPNIDGLTGKESNPLDPSDPNSKTVPVSFDAPYVIGVNPGHDVTSTRREIYGDNKKNDHPKMNGFVYEMVVNGYNAEQVKQPMRCYNSTSLSVSSTLALEYALFDRWYASIPGPTEPNRMYFHSGTSHGADFNDVTKLVEGYPQRTIFDDIYDSGLDWQLYYSDFPTTLMLRRVRDYPDHIRFYHDFFSAAADGTLPSYSFIEPRWFTLYEWPQNDEHPPHSASLGSSS